MILLLPSGRMYGNRGGDKMLQLLLDLCEYEVAG